MRLPIEPKLPDLPVRSVAEMGLKELERVRLILRGGSVVDWRRLHFRNRDEVDRFLRLCGLDLTHPEDEAWARLVLVGRGGVPAPDLLLPGGGRGGAARRRSTTSSSTPRG